MRESAWWVLVVAALVTTTSCKPRPGERCAPGKRACYDPKTELVCANGAYVPNPCKGPDGCKEKDDDVSCDMRGNDGESCASELAGRSACLDAKTNLTCFELKYHKEPCRGPKGCAPGGKPYETMCDRSLGEAGDSCTTMLRCSSDYSHRLLCENHKYTVLEKCSGPKHCFLKGNEGTACDITGAFSVGDICHEPHWGDGRACTPDGKSTVKCKAGKFVAGQDCPGPQHCHGEGTCDMGIASLGDACTGDAKVCSDDGKTVLECRGNKYAKEKSCPQSCAFKDGKPSCS